MLVLCVDFLVLFNNVNFKIVISFPFRFSDFTHSDFFEEYSVTNVVSEQFLADTSVFFALVHESPQEKREVN